MTLLWVSNIGLSELANHHTATSCACRLVPILIFVGFWLRSLLLQTMHCSYKQYIHESTLIEPFVTCLFKQEVKQTNNKVFKVSASIKYNCGDVLNLFLI